MGIEAEWHHWAAYKIIRHQPGLPKTWQGYLGVNHHPPYFQKPYNEQRCISLKDRIKMRSYRSVASVKRFSWSSSGSKLLRLSLNSWSSSELSFVLVVGSSLCCKLYRLVIIGSGHRLQNAVPGFSTDVPFVNSAYYLHVVDPPDWTLTRSSSELSARKTPS